MARVRKSDIGWNDDAKLWLCRALIHPPSDDSHLWWAYSKDLADVEAASGNTEIEAITKLKVGLKAKLEEHLGPALTGKVPFADISGYRPFGAYVKILGVAAAEPKKPE